MFIVISRLVPENIIVMMRIGSIGMRFILLTKDGYQ